MGQHKRAVKQNSAVCMFELRGASEDPSTKASKPSKVKGRNLFFQKRCVCQKAKHDLRGKSEIFEFLRQSSSTTCIFVLLEIRKTAWSVGADIQNKSSKTYQREKFKCPSTAKPCDSCHLSTLDLTKAIHKRNAATCLSRSLR